MLFFATNVILMSVVKTRKVGGSIVVMLPKNLYKAGKSERRTLGNNCQKVKIDGFGALKGMKPFILEDELKVHD